MKSKWRYAEEALLSSLDEEYRGLWRKDIYGKPILTLWKWIAEGDWLSAFSKQHPEVQLINATEGGIGFPDIPNMPFQKVIGEYLEKSYDLVGLVHGEIQRAAMPQVTREKMKEVTLALQESLEKCIQQIDILRDELKQESKKETTEGVAKGGIAALAETELYEEPPAYKYIL